MGDKIHDSGSSRYENDSSISPIAALARTPPFSSIISRFIRNMSQYFMINCWSSGPSPSIHFDGTEWLKKIHVPTLLNGWDKDDLSI